MKYFYELTCKYCGHVNHGPNAGYVYQCKKCRKKLILDLSKNFLIVFGVLLVVAHRLDEYYTEGDNRMIVWATFLGLLSLILYIFKKRDDRYKKRNTKVDHD